MSIRFEMPDHTSSVTIPAAAMTISGFAPGEDAQYHTLSGAVVVLKKQMTAAQLIRAAWSLKQLSAELCTELAMLCRAGDCSECADEVKGCPYNALDFTHEIDLPDELLEMAGIPSGAPLHLELEDGEVIISSNHDGPGLWDVPAPLMKGFLAAGICPGELDEKLKTGEIVYGK